MPASSIFTSAHLRETGTLDLFVRLTGHQFAHLLDVPWCHLDASLGTSPGPICPLILPSLRKVLKGQLRDAGLGADSLLYILLMRSTSM